MNQGWEIKRLGEVVDVLDNLRKPITKRDRVEGDYPYYGATGILSYVHKYIFSEKLILIGEDGAKWASGDNTSFIVTGQYWVNNHAHVIRPNRKILIDEWIVYFLNFSDLTPFITGMTVPKLNQEKMRSIPLPLPPLPEQQRIVAILDEAFAAIDQAKANTERNLMNVKELFESYLRGVFENNTDGWETRKLTEIATVKTGKYDANHANDNGAYRFYTCAFKYSMCDTKRFTGACIILPGNGVNVGEAFFYDGEFDAYQRTYVVHNIEINPRFLHYHMQLYWKALGTRLQYGSATNFIKIGNFQDYSVAFPSLLEQKNIVANLSAFSDRLNTLDETYKQKLGDLDELKKSILQKAFTGELTSA